MKLTILLTTALTMLGLASGQLQDGADIPEVEARNHFGKETKIEAAEEDEYLLVFFYPKALTGG